MTKVLKSVFVLIFLMTFAGVTSAQFTKSIQLKPIYKHGWRYFYDTKKVNSAYSLQIPLEGIQNKDVDRYFKSFKTLQTLRGIVYIPALMYLFTNNIGSSKQNYDTYWYLTLAGIAGDVTFNIISQNRMSKAIDIYNVSIAHGASLSLQMDKIKNSQTLISFGIRQRF